MGGGISRILSWVIIPLGPPLPAASSCLPESSLPEGIAARATPPSPTWHCSKRGLPCQSDRPDLRWALTPPFHPYLPCGGGMFSVALSVGLPLLDVIQRFALWSPDFPQAGITGLRSPPPPIDRSV